MTTVTIRQVEQAIHAILAEQKGEGFPRPVARGVVVNPDRQIVRGKPNNGNDWQYPGGGLDKGETSLEAAIRETWEEARVVADRVAGVEPFPAIVGHRCSECLAFGAPRRYKPGRWMSQSADDLLREAARRLGLDEQDYLRCRYDWFDRLGKKLKVPWRGVITYHVLALKEAKPFRPGRHRWDWRCRDWFDLEELRRRTSLGGHTHQLLDWSLEEKGSRAAEASRRYEQEHDG